MKRTDGWVFIVNPIAGNGFAGSLVPTRRLRGFFFTPSSAEPVRL